MISLKKCCTVDCIGKPILCVSIESVLTEDFYVFVSKLNDIKGLELSGGKSVLCAIFIALDVVMRNHSFFLTFDHILKVVLLIWLLVLFSFQEPWFIHGIVSKGKPSVSSQAHILVDTINTIDHQYKPFIWGRFIKTCCHVYALQNWAFYSVFTLKYKHLRLTH